MDKNIFYIFFLLIAGCSQPPENTKPKPLVLVSVAPYRFLAEQIGKNEIEVESIVPPNTNPHIFEPTPKQVAKIARGDVWFQIGESFEEKITPFLKEKNPRLIYSDLRDQVDLIPETHESSCSCSKNHLDRHIWMSPKLAAIQAGEIEKILSAKWPEKKEFFQTNLKLLQEDLLKLDLEIKASLKSFKNSSLLVSHPAFGYFCKEYGLEQLSVEYEGKDPRPRHLEKIMKEAKRSELKAAVTLPQYNNKAILLIAEKLHLPTKMIDPYSSDYVATLKELTEAIAQ